MGCAEHVHNTVSIYRALLQKKPVFLRSLRIITTPYHKLLVGCHSGKCGSIQTLWTNSYNFLATRKAKFLNGAEVAPPQKTQSPPQKMQSYHAIKNLALRLRMAGLQNAICRDMSSF